MKTQTGLICLLFIAVVTIENGQCRKLDECQMAREFVKQGLSRNQMNDWVCLAMGESSGNTAAINHVNADGSKDYGIFQINNRYWCENGRRGKECNVDCNSLLDDDITDDVKCAKKIYSAQGFSAWVAWNNKCSNGRAPSVDRCF